MQVAVPQETYPGERRVALTPAAVAALVKLGLEVNIQAGAGDLARYPDQAYADQGARILESRDDIFSADIVVQVRCLGANRDAGQADLERLSEGQV